MAKLTSSLCFLGFLLCLFAYSTSEDPLWAELNQGKTWCVAKVDAEGVKLQGFLDYCCSRISCAEILPGGTCYAPDTLRDHGSYALNLYFRIFGECNYEIGCLTLVNPSHDICHFV